MNSSSDNYNVYIKTGDTVPDVTEYSGPKVSGALHDCKSTGSNMENDTPKNYGGNIAATKTSSTDDLNLIEDRNKLVNNTVNAIQSDNAGCDDTSYLKKLVSNALKNVFALECGALKEESLSDSESSVLLSECKFSSSENSSMRSERSASHSKSSSVSSGESFPLLNIYECIGDSSDVNVELPTVKSSIKVDACNKMFIKEEGGDDDFCSATRIIGSDVCLSDVVNSKVGVADSCVMENSVIENSTNFISTNDNEINKDVVNNENVLVIKIEDENSTNVILTNDNEVNKNITGNENVSVIKIEDENSSNVIPTNGNEVNKNITGNENDSIIKIEGRNRRTNQKQLKEENSTDVIPTNDNEINKNATNNNNDSIIKIEGRNRRMNQKQLKAENGTNVIPTNDNEVNKNITDNENVSIIIIEDENSSNVIPTNDNDINKDVPNNDNVSVIKTEDENSADAIPTNDNDINKDVSGNENDSIIKIEGRNRRMNQKQLNYENGTDVIPTNDNEVNKNITDNKNVSIIIIEDENSSDVIPTNDNDINKDATNNENVSVIKIEDENSADVIPTNDNDINKDVANNEIVSVIKTEDENSADVIPTNDNEVNKNITGNNNDSIIIIEDENSTDVIPTNDNDINKDVANNENVSVIKIKDENSADVIPTNDNEINKDIMGNENDSIIKIEGRNRRTNQKQLEDENRADVIPTNDNEINKNVTNNNNDSIIKIEAENSANAIPTNDNEINKDVINNSNDLIIKIKDDQNDEDIKKKTNFNCDDLKLEIIDVDALTQIKDEENTELFKEHQIVKDGRKLVISLKNDKTNSKMEQQRISMSQRFVSLKFDPKDVIDISENDDKTICMVEANEVGNENATKNCEIRVNFEEANDIITTDEIVISSDDEEINIFDENDKIKHEVSNSDSSAEKAGNCASPKKTNEINSPLVSLAPETEFADEIGENSSEQTVRMIATRTRSHLKVITDNDVNKTVDKMEGKDIKAKKLASKRNDIKNTCLKKLTVQIDVSKEINEKISKMLLETETEMDNYALSDAAQVECMKETETSTNIHSETESVKNVISEIGKKVIHDKTDKGVNVISSTENKIIHDETDNDVNVISSTDNKIENVKIIHDETVKDVNVISSTENKIENVKIIHDETDKGVNVISSTESNFNNPDTLKTIIETVEMLRGLLCKNSGEKAKRAEVNEDLVLSAVDKCILKLEEVSKNKNVESETPEQSKQPRPLLERLLSPFSDTSTNFGDDEFAELPNEEPSSFDGVKSSLNGEETGRLKPAGNDKEDGELSSISECLLTNVLQQPGEERFRNCNDDQNYVAKNQAVIEISDVSSGEQILVKVAGRQCRNNKRHHNKELSDRKTSSRKVYKKRLHHPFAEARRGKHYTSDSDCGSSDDETSRRKNLRRAVGKMHKECRCKRKHLKRRGVERSPITIYSSDDDKASKKHGAKESDWPPSENWGDEVAPSEYCGDCGLNSAQSAWQDNSTEHESYCAENKRCTDDNSSSNQNPKYNTLKNDQFDKTRRHKRREKEARGERTECESIKNVNKSRRQKSDDDMSQVESIRRQKSDDDMSQVEPIRSDRNRRRQKSDDDMSQVESIRSDRSRRRQKSDDMSQVESIRSDRNRREENWDNMSQSSQSESIKHGRRKHLRSDDDASQAESIRKQNSDDDRSIRSVLNRRRVTSDDDRSIKSDRRCRKSDDDGAKAKKCNYDGTKSTKYDSYESTKYDNYESTKYDNYDSTKSTKYDKYESAKAKKFDRDSTKSTNYGNYESTKAKKNNRDSTNYDNYESTKYDNYESTKYDNYESTKAKKFDRDSAKSTKYNYDKPKKFNYTSTKSKNYDYESGKPKKYAYDGAYSTTYDYESAKPKKYDYDSAKSKKYNYDSTMSKKYDYDGTQSKKHDYDSTMSKKYDKNTEKVCSNNENWPPSDNWDNELSQNDEILSTTPKNNYVNLNEQNGDESYRNYAKNGQNELSSDRNKGSGDLNERSGVQNERSGDPNERSSDRNECSIDRNEHSSDRNECSSDRNERSSDRNERSSERNERSSERNACSSDRNERSFNPNERSNDRNECSIDRNEHSIERNERSSEHNKCSSDRNERSINRNERSINRNERSSDRNASRSDRNKRSNKRNESTQKLNTNKNDDWPPSENWDEEMSENDGSADYNVDETQCKYKETYINTRDKNRGKICSYSSKADSFNDNTTLKLNITQNNDENLRCNGNKLSIDIDELIKKRQKHKKAQFNYARAPFKHHEEMCASLESQSYVNASFECQNDGNVSFERQNDGNESMERQNDPTNEVVGSAGVLKIKESACVREMDVSDERKLQILGDQVIKPPNAAEPSTSLCRELEDVLGDLSRQNDTCLTDGVVDLGNSAVATENSTETTKNNAKNERQLSEGEITDSDEADEKSISGILNEQQRLQKLIAEVGDDGVSERTDFDDEENYLNVRYAHDKKTRYREGSYIHAEKGGRYVRLEEDERYVRNGEAYMYEECETSYVQEEESVLGSPKEQGFGVKRTLHFSKPFNTHKLTPYNKKKNFKRHKTSEIDEQSALQTFEEQLENYKQKQLEKQHQSNTQKQQRHYNNLLHFGATFSSSSDETDYHDNRKKVIKDTSRDDLQLQPVKGNIEKDFEHYFSLNVTNSSSDEDNVKRSPHINDYFDQIAKRYIKTVSKLTHLTQERMLKFRAEKKRHEAVKQTLLKLLPKNQSVVETNTSRNNVCDTTTSPERTQLHYKNTINLSDIEQEVTKKLNVIRTETELHLKSYEEEFSISSNEDSSNNNKDTSSDASLIKEELVRKLQLIKTKGEILNKLETTKKALVERTKLKQCKKRINRNNVSIKSLGIMTNMTFMDNFRHDEVTQSSDDESEKAKDPPQWTLIRVQSPDEPPMRRNRDEGCYKRGNSFRLVECELSKYQLEPIDSLGDEGAESSAVKRRRGSKCDVGDSKVSSSDNSTANIVAKTITDDATKLETERNGLNTNFVDDGNLKNSACIVSASNATTADGIETKINDADATNCTSVKRNLDEMKNANIKDLNSTSAVSLGSTSMSVSSLSDNEIQEVQMRSGNVAPYCNNYEKFDLSANAMTCESVKTFKDTFALTGDDVETKTLAGDDVVTKTLTGDDVETTTPGNDEMFANSDKMLASTSESAKTSTCGSADKTKTSETERNGLNTNFVDDGNLNRTVPPGSEELYDPFEPTSDSKDGSINAHPIEKANVNNLSIESVVAAESELTDFTLDIDVDGGLPAPSARNNFIPENTSSPLLKRDSVVDNSTSLSVLSNVTVTPSSFERKEMALTAAVTSSISSVDNYTSSIAADTSNENDTKKITLTDYKTRANSTDSDILNTLGAANADKVNDDNLYENALQRPPDRFQTSPSMSPDEIRKRIEKRIKNDASKLTRPLVPYDVQDEPVLKYTEHCYQPYPVIPGPPLLPFNPSIMRYQTPFSPVYQALPYQPAPPFPMQPYQPAQCYQPLMPMQNEPILTKRDPRNRVQKFTEAPLDQGLVINVQPCSQIVSIFDITYDDRIPGDPRRTPRPTFCRDVMQLHVLSYRNCRATTRYKPPPPPSEFELISFNDDELEMFSRKRHNKVTPYYFPNDKNRNVFCAATPTPVSAEKAFLTASSSTSSVSEASINKTFAASPDDKDLSSSVREAILMLGAQESITEAPSETPETAASLPSEVKASEFIPCKNKVLMKPLVTSTKVTKKLKISSETSKMSNERAAELSLEKSEPIKATVSKISGEKASEISTSNESAVGISCKKSKALKTSKDRKGSLDESKENSSRKALKTPKGTRASFRLSEMSKTSNKDAPLTSSSKRRVSRISSETSLMLTETLKRSRERALSATSDASKERAPEKWAKTSKVSSELPFDALNRSELVISFETLKRTASAVSVFKGNTSEESAKAKSLEAPNEKSPEATNEKSLEATKKKSAEATNVKSPEMTNVKSPEVTDRKSPEATNVQSAEATNERSPEVMDEKSPELMDEKSPEATNKKSPEVTNEKLTEMTGEKSPEVSNKKSPEVTNKKSPEVSNEKLPEMTSEKSPEVTDEQSPEAANETSLEAAKVKSLETAKDQSLETAKEISLEAAKNKSYEATENKSFETAKDKPLESTKEMSLKTAKEMSLATPNETSLETSKEIALETSNRRASSVSAEKSKATAAEISSETPQTSEETTSSSISELKKLCRKEAVVILQDLALLGKFNVTKHCTLRKALRGRPPKILRNVSSKAPSSKTSKASLRRTSTPTLRRTSKASSKLLVASEPVLYSTIEAALAREAEAALVSSFEVAPTSTSEPASSDAYVNQLLKPASTNALDDDVSFEVWLSKLETSNCQSNTQSMTSSSPNCQTLAAPTKVPSVRPTTRSLTKTSKCRKKDQMEGLPHAVSLDHDYTLGSVKSEDGEAAVECTESVVKIEAGCDVYDHPVVKDELPLIKTEEVIVEDETIEDIANFVASTGVQRSVSEKSLVYRLEETFEESCYRRYQLKRCSVPVEKLKTGKRLRYEIDENDKVVFVKKHNKRKLQVHSKSSIAKQFIKM